MSDRQRRTSGLAFVAGVLAGLVLSGVGYGQLRETSADGRRRAVFAPHLDRRAGSSRDRPLPPGLPLAPHLLSLRS
jgi:hypothetical protein